MANLSPSPIDCLAPPPPPPPVGSKGREWASFKAEPTFRTSSSWDDDGDGNHSDGPGIKSAVRSTHHQRRSSNRRTGRETLSSDMLGRSLHSALHRTNRTQKPFSYDDFGNRSPSTPDRRSILRKRFHRTELVTSGRGLPSSENHQTFESNRSNSYHRRRQTRPIRSRRRTSDLYVHSGGGDGEGKGSDSEGDDFGSGLSDEPGEDEECGSHGSPAVRAPSPLGICGRRPRKDSDDGDRGNNHEVHHCQPLATAIGAVSGGWGCGHHAGFHTQDVFSTLAARQRRVMYIILTCLTVCALYMYFELHNHIVRHETLLSYLSGKHAIVEQLHRMQQQGIMAGADRYTDTPGRQGTARKGGMSTEKDAERRIADLSGRVESLQRTLQRMARQRLVDDYSLVFPEDGAQGSSNPSLHVDVMLDLNGLQSPLVIQVAGSKMPYTTWTFLSQLRDGNWALRGNHQWFEIVSVASASDHIGVGDEIGEGVPSLPGTDDKIPVAPGSEDLHLARRHTIHKGDHEGRKGGSTPHRLDFLEDSAIELDRRFVLGIRNPKAGEEFPVVSIYSERGMCGSYEDEVCFGRVTDGFDSFNHINRMVEEENIKIEKVSVRQNESTGDFRRFIP
jgi:hypothetical protein